jgi:hypothetical protein
MNEKAFNPDPMFRQRKPIGTQPEAVAGLIRFIDALLPKVHSGDIPGGSCKVGHIATGDRVAEPAQASARIWPKVMGGPAGLFGPGRVWERSPARPALGVH